MTGIARGLARRVFEGVLSWPFPRPTAKALVEREGEDGRGYLLVRQERSDGEQWLVPGGGVEAGEDPRAALAREVSEETGVDVTVGEPLDAWAFDTAMGAPRRNAVSVYRPRGRADGRAESRRRTARRGAVGASPGGHRPPDAG